MKLNTHLSQDRFSWMRTHLTAADRASVLVEVQAPFVEARREATPTNLVVVLDRSGSMGGGRLSHAKRALCDIVDRLSPTDTFGLVTFDDQVEVNVDAGPVIDRDAIKRTIKSIDARGSTDLGSGLLRGLKEARRLEALSGVCVLLISDGHANVGVTDADVLGARTAQFIDQRITTSTLGMGLGYDEVLLNTIARLGGGNERFAEEADTAAGMIAAECGDLLSQRFLSCRLTVVKATGATDMRVLNEATTRTIDDGLQIELGGLQPEELRTLVLQFSPRQAARPGRRKLATLRLDYTLADDLSDHSVSHTVWAQVCAESDLAPVVNRDVAAEVVFQRVQRRKRDGSKALSYGDIEQAQYHFDRAIQLVKTALTDVPRARRAEFLAEIDLIDRLRMRIQVDGLQGVAFAAKMMSSDVNMKSRRSGRRGA